MDSGLSRLILGLLCGALVGVVYGWLVQPVEYIDTSPDSLRIDFRTDYVLMTAEAYASDQDLNLARFRLAALGPLPPEAYASQAIDYALQHSFGPTDLQRLNQLALALRSQPQADEIGAP